MRLAVSRFRFLEMLKYPDLPDSSGKRVPKGVLCPLLSVNIQMSYWSVFSLGRCCCPYEKHRGVMFFYVCWLSHITNQYSRIVLKPQQKSGSKCDILRLGKIAD